MFWLPILLAVFLTILLDQGSANTFYKGLDSKYVGFAGYTVFVTTTQSCHYKVKASTHNKYINECGCFKEFLFIRTGDQPDLAWE